MEMIEIEQVGLDAFVCTGSPFQSRCWAEAKRQSGWTAYAFSVRSGDWESSLLVLVKRIVPFCRLAYVPFGPDLSGCPDGGMSGCLDEISSLLRHLLPKSVFAIRYDLPWDEVDDPNVARLEGKRFRTCEESVQPEGTVRIDLGAGYGQVASRYRERARRSLRRSSRDVSVSLWDGSDDDFDRWYAVYRETARRDGFTARSAGYLRSLLSLGGKEGGDVRCDLVLAREDGAVIGGIVVLSGGEEAVYLFGASLRDGHAGCSHALQDFAIRSACERGYRFYDLFGIPGPMGRGSHLEGLELFKLSFGGQRYYRTPTSDYVCRALVRDVFVRAERLRYRINRRPRTSGPSQVS
jgi:lipid II:glycine glycyltransferase (peptidoglycan interpeptide bridge formation enzyme)